MSALEDDYLSVAEAATLLRVAPSTIRRWIRSGDVAAHRLGPRRVALRRSDVAALIVPLHPTANGAETSADDASGESLELTPEEILRQQEAMERYRRLRDKHPMEIDRSQIRKRTPEETNRALEALAQIERLSEEILLRRGGKPFSSSVQIIHEMRDERDRQLLGE
jgi:excisionase family DNA binding protein